MIDVRFVPIEKWPKKETASRANAPFRATYTKTLDLLETELKHLNARDIVIQSFFKRKDLRNDGWPRSSAARPSKPGIILGFDRRDQRYKDNKWVWEVTEMSFPCDRFVSWEDNLRAVALALEALRKIDRYGITQTGEQYKGWARLPEPAAPDQMTREEAALFIAGYSTVPKDYILMGGENLQSAYRKAAALLHPDASTGGHEAFLRLQMAKEILEGKR